MTDRDPQLTAELERLPVPEHGDGFYAAVRAELEQSRAPRRPWVRLPYLGAATAVAATALALALIDLTGGAGTASAADVRSAVTRALASVERLGGVLVVREQGAAGGELRWRFVLDADGDFRLDAASNPSVFAYDQSEHVERVSDVGFFTERAGIAPGPPDPDASDWTIRRGLGSVVRALAAGRDAGVSEVEYDGRPAWILNTRTQNAGEERAITVDRRTGLPVRDSVFRAGRLASDWRIESLSLDPAIPPGGFELRPRADQQVTRYDHGFRRMLLGDVADLVGYRPLAPAWVPAGFRRSDVAAASSSRPTGNEQRRNPPSRGVVSLGYRRGLDEIVVTTRLVGNDPGQWTDPVAVGDLSGRPERARLGRGPLAGQRAEIALDPNSIPHLWGLAGSLVVTIAGDLTRGELIRVAESLTAHGG